MADLTKKRTLDDYMATPDAPEERIQVNLDPYYSKKLIDIKEHFNIARNADWVKRAIDFQYDEIMSP